MKSTTPLAENHITISRALFDEGMRAVESKEYKKSVKKVAVSLIIIFVIAATWLLYTGGTLLFLLGEGIFLGALLFWLMIMLPDSRRKGKYKAMMQGCDNAPTRTTVFYQDYLTVIANNGNETTIPYNDIIGYQETRNLYILNCKNTVNVLLDKTEFSTGNFDAVKIFFSNSKISQNGAVLSGNSTF